MNKFTVKKEVWFWLIIIAPFVFAYIYWDKIPQTIPTHWGIDGKPNGYSTKGFGLLVLPLINIAIYILLLVVPRIDPKKNNYQQFEGVYTVIRLIIHTFLSVLFVLMLLSAMQYPVNMKLIGQLMLPIMFMVLGNFMGKIRPNYFVGVRTPWTLASETVWIKTHRLTGSVWVAGSIVYLIAALFFPNTVQLQLAYIVVLVVVPIAASYLYFRAIEKSGKGQ